MRAYLFSGVVLLAGCQVTDVQQSSIEAESAFQPGVFTPVSQNTHPATIQDHIRMLMNQMALTMQEVHDNTAVVVADFVYVDGAYDKSGLLGQQVAQSFMNELHQFGVKVLDHKTMDYIRVTESGDLVLSRDYTELRPDIQASLVLTGTLTKHRLGVMVQARLVDLKSKELKGSAQTLLPSAQVNALIASHSRQDMPASGR
ncbi:hypothetical protein KJY73_16650 [Bowmanella sp. Y26]|uniref:FlgO family outer membrane protein n=1 Tax=Bowmanella yangjiangensis TaxID=2811230 RepID=UPI001BDBE3DB|nr:hypothetical protein [Bowmanella yangjiangensis]